ncbi:hypothetical protein [Nodularia sp. UHCC 0506]|uniref:hypothetical protein n=1 Tax=Nodularia sp. UHCC 0506 TaxID=3110243 RepID=UPI002B22053B|nr:hypothetical protein [Nodularia sp. UHCC 0506]MEA5513235.1 hypothetical protein [Nodularia sp. UHCC 0506]
MTSQEFLESLATATTDPEKLMVVAEYLETTAMDNATTPRWRSIPYSSEIDMALKNLAFHLAGLAETKN